MVDEILSRIQNIIAEKLEIEASKVRLESRFREDLNMDSLDAVELIIACEEAFGVAISDEDAVRFVTVGDAVRYIEICLSGPAENAPQFSETISVKDWVQLLQFKERLKKRRDGLYAVLNEVSGLSDEELFIYEGARKRIFEILENKRQQITAWCNSEKFRQGVNAHEYLPYPLAPDLLFSKLETLEDILQVSSSILFFEDAKPLLMQMIMSLWLEQEECFSTLPEQLKVLLMHELQARYILSREEQHIAETVLDMQNKYYGGYDGWRTDVYGHFAPFLESSSVRVIIDEFMNCVSRQGLVYAILHEELDMQVATCNTYNHAFLASEDSLGVFRILELSGYRVHSYYPTEVSLFCLSGDINPKVVLFGRPVSDPTKKLVNHFFVLNDCRVIDEKERVIVHLGQDGYTLNMLMNYVVARSIDFITQLDISANLHLLELAFQICPGSEVVNNQLALALVSSIPPRYFEACVYFIISAYLNYRYPQPIYYLATILPREYSKIESSSQALDNEQRRQFLENMETVLTNLLLSERREKLIERMTREVKISEKNINEQEAREKIDTVVTYLTQLRKTLEYSR